DVLEDVISEHPVLLNRAPTLHRLGIQAFEPVLVEGKALKLHPLVCTAFNADFDGDQMAVHLPLSAEAQAEARILMLSANNLIKPQDGKPVTVPTQDMVLGSYYLTLKDDREIGTGKTFGSFNEATLAYYNGAVALHAPIRVRITKMIDGVSKTGIIDATVGRLIFNEKIPQNLGFIDRSDPNHELDLEIGDNVLVRPKVKALIDDMVEPGVDKKILGKIIDASIKVNGITDTATLLDDIKEMGYKYSTIGAVTVGVSDMKIPKEKKALLKHAEEEIEVVVKNFRRGLLTDEERYTKVINIWNETSNKVTNALMDNLEQLNPIYMMANSGARGSVNQIRQLAAMRGLMADTSGRTIEIPIKANFREGLTVLEYFISTHGARKGLTDTALRTADSGYLTRRLVDVSQEVIVREDDCGTEDGIIVRNIMDGNEVIEPLSDRLEGRTVIGDLLNPKDKTDVIVKDGEIITADQAKKIIVSGIKEVKIRSVVKCRSKVGICAKCYGNNLATGKLVNMGEAVGIIAAQSIGEPGTQLTMRTFHAGGVAGDDITQGLPRVEELFEARRPKGVAIVAELNGTAHLTNTNKRREITVTNQENGEAETYLIPFGSRIKVREDDKLEAGDPLTEGSLNPHDILDIKGPTAVQNYFIQEVQRVYRLQGVDINDKHIEVIVRQMMHKVKIEDAGDTHVLTGALINIYELEAINNKVVAEGGRPAEYSSVLMGITKAALSTDSFLSAASFQETTRVLTDAAIKGKRDPLLGLKENVIIGKLIPAGTGIAAYNDITVFPTYSQKEEEDEVETFEASDFRESLETHEIKVENEIRIEPRI
ncbi:MAG: DNA-directed RNA polymerase subunit beta', partial [Oscillospiraceae bacterium]